MKMRTKFKVVMKDVAPDESVSTLKLEAVVDGSAENAAFFKATPAGHVAISVVSEKIGEQFEIGQEFYVDFTPVK